MKYSYLFAILFSLINLPFSHCLALSNCPSTPPTIFGTHSTNIKLISGDELGEVTGIYTDPNQSNECIQQNNHYWYLDTKHSVKNFVNARSNLIDWSYDETMYLLTSSPT